MFNRQTGGQVGRQAGSEEREGNTAESVKPQKCCECAVPFIPLQVQAGVSLRTGAVAECMPLTAAEITS